MLDPSNQETRGIDREKLDGIVAPIARAFGAELVDVDWKREQGGWVLRLYVEKAGASEHRMTTEQAAVNLDLCTNVAREVSPALDVADFIPHAYSLEVSSPGVERPLRTDADFRRFAGQRAKLKVHEAVAGQKVLIGTLGALEDGVLILHEGSVERRIPVTNVASGRLVFEFGPAPKPTKPKPGKSSRAKG